MRLYCGGCENRTHICGFWPKKLVLPQLTRVLGVHYFYAILGETAVLAFERTLSMAKPVCPWCQASFRFAKKVKELTNRSFMVGETGLEPARPYDHQILSLRRLPVTPLPHVKAYWGQGATPG